jgi:hypothetical protein
VLLRLADRLAQADEQLARRITPEVVRRIVDLVPHSWLEGEAAFADVQAHRDAYVEHLAGRLQPPRAFVEEALRARSASV